MHMLGVWERRQWVFEVQIAVRTWTGHPECVDATAVSLSHCTRLVWWWTQLASSQATPYRRTCQSTQLYCTVSTQNASVTCKHLPLKICKVTFIQHAGISQRIRISQFCLREDKGHNFFLTFCAILVMIGPLRSRREFLYLLGWDGKNRHIISNISASTEPNVTNFLALIGSCTQIIKLKYFF